MYYLLAALLPIILPFACALTIAWLGAALLLDALTFKPHAKPVKKRKGYDRWVPAMAGEHEGEVDAIIIGSGMAGLHCAALLSTFGKRVVVLEQHETAGGGAHCYAVDGRSKWKFDSGLHYTIPQSGALLALACGASQPPVQMSRMGVPSDAGNVYDRVLLAGAGQEPLEIVDEVQLLAELRRRFPTAAATGLDRYVKVCAGVLMRFPFWCLSALLPHTLRRVFLRSPLMAHWRQWAGKTASAALDELLPGDDTETNLLKAYFCGLWIDGGSPPDRMSFFMLAATSIGFPHVGGAYPDGGPDAMARALVDAIEARGGRVYTRAEVASIDTAAEGKRGGERVTGVTMVDGSTLSSPVVVSACGWRVTTSRLLAPGVAQAHGLSPSELGVAQSDGFVMCNIGLEGSAHELGLDCSNLWLQPCSAARGHDLGAGVRAYFDDPLGVDESQVPLMITVPSTKDRTWHDAHPHESMIQTIALAPWDWFRAHQAEERPAARNAPPNVRRERQAEYDALKAAWRRRCVGAVQRHFPKVTDDAIKFADLSTPLTIEHYLPSGAGSGIGLDVTPERFTDLDAIRRLDMRTRVRGLWLTGQDTLCAGQPLAQMSGILTALRIVGPFRLAAFVWRILRFHVLVGKLKYKDVSTW